MKNQRQANAVALTWEDPKTREARLKRHPVIVQVANGDFVHYKSVPKACHAIGVHKTKDQQNIRLAVVRAAARNVPFTIVLDGYPVVFVRVDPQ